MAGTDPRGRPSEGPTPTRIRPVVAAIVAVAVLAGFNVAIVTGEWIIPAALGALLVIVAGAVALARALAPTGTAHDTAPSPTPGGREADAPEAEDEIDWHDLPLDRPGHGEAVEPSGDAPRQRQR